MVTILPPDASLTFIAAVVGPLVLGFLVGIIVKHALKIGVALAALVIVLIALGIVSPTQVIQPLLGLVQSGSGLATKAEQLTGYLPYSSLTFIVGLALGFLKG